MEIINVTITALSTSWGYQTSELRQAMTIQLVKRLNECARNLNDGKLLTVLGGDVVAQELKYHYCCLTALYNKEKAYRFIIENQNDRELSEEKEFVCMIEHGTDIKSQLRFGASKIDLTMAHLLQYNCYAKYREGAATHIHSKDRETPFAVILHEWLEKVSRIEASDEDNNIKWSAQHASKKRGPVFDGWILRSVHLSANLKGQGRSSENQSFPAALGGVTWWIVFSMRISLFLLHLVIMVIFTAFRNRSFRQYWRPTLLPPDTEPEAGVIIFDGSALINALPPRISKKFEEYAAPEVVPKVQTYSCIYTTVIVFDVY
ncbi:unnamed protein product [Mytilus coruscus]|uniref:Uncharacterized protein n=1 Tax=Mytilus coruscus TaxID=42192 RepID=A0A6J8C346_MYTCO|nr:unnamed protein product [Mytilus coruscus]